MNSFINLFNSSVAECWDCKGLSQFRVKELKYSELAREIAVLQVFATGGAAIPPAIESLLGRQPRV